MAYDKLNLYDVHRKGSKERLRTAVLETVCEYYGVYIYASHARYSTICRSGTSRGKWLLFHRKLEKDTDLCVFVCFIYQKDVSLRMGV